MIITGIGQCSLDYLALVDTYPQIDTKEEVLEWHEQGGGRPHEKRLALCCREGEVA